MKSWVVRLSVFLLASVCNGRPFHPDDPPTFHGVEAVVGVGSLITGNHTDYKVNSSTNVLEGSLIGRSSPQFLVGVAFQLPGRGFKKGEDWIEKPWHAFVSLKFASGSTSTIVGYVFGISYKIHKNLDLLAGYAQTPFNEPSPGFKTAAVQAVAQNPLLYPTFNAPALNNNIAGAFDGFPLQKQGSSMPSANLYQGSPLETHYRGGAILGISFTFDLKGLFTPAGTPKTP